MKSRTALAHCRMPWLPTAAAGLHLPQFVSLIVAAAGCQFSSSLQLSRLPDVTGSPSTSNNTEHEVMNAVDSLPSAAAAAASSSVQLLHALLLSMAYRCGIKRCLYGSNSNDTK
ncbi:PREDICTED: uncharacterized protein LOC104600467 [Nelumbo nucifera]|uniref:Uncharacterized protein LOC104600467 n=1 Tax=Nelumbo nucifera TaxID=4432 RepID=A0A1U8Q5I2_NELNU|nr:PREDICTED: uncharacterized protein LOC104600467 [Nelumbo nucifera]